MHVNIFVFLIWSGVCYGGETNKIIGGVQEQDASDPKYQEMANELVHSYLNVRDQDKRNVTVIKVTTQVVSGIITEIKLRLFLVSGQSTTCDFSVWGQQWKNVKHVTHKCDLEFHEKLSSSKFLQREKYRNPKNIKYLDLARLCLDSLFEAPGRKPFYKRDVKAISVSKAKVSVKSVIDICLEIDVLTINNVRFKCTSWITESPWSQKNPEIVAQVICKKVKDHSNDDDDDGDDKYQPPTTKPPPPTTDPPPTTTNAPPPTKQPDCLDPETSNYPCCECILV